MLAGDAAAGANDASAEKRWRYLLPAVDVAPCDCPLLPTPLPADLPAGCAFGACFASRHRTTDAVGKCPMSRRFPRLGQGRRDARIRARWNRKTSIPGSTPGAASSKDPCYLASPPSRRRLPVTESHHLRRHRRDLTGSFGGTDEAGDPGRSLLLHRREGMREGRPPSQSASSASHQPTAPLCDCGGRLWMPVAGAWYGKARHGRQNEAWRDTPRRDKLGTS